MQPAEYVLIAAWGKSLGSMSYYVRDQQHKAARDNAPVDAVYFAPEQNRWVTLAECVQSTQEDVNRVLRDIL